MDTQELVEKLTQALAFKFPNDSMVPGVTIAFLRNKNFYVSLVRYNPTKKVVHKTQHSDLNEALVQVGRQLLDDETEVPRNPIDELNNLLSPSPVWSYEPESYLGDEDDYNREMDDFLGESNDFF